MERIRWTCDACEAVHHYIPAKCCQCGAGREEEKKAEITFDNLMEELEDNDGKK